MADRHSVWSRSVGKKKVGVCAATDSRQQTRNTDCYETLEKLWEISRHHRPSSSSACLHGETIDRLHTLQLHKTNKRTQTHADRKKSFAGRLPSSGFALRQIRGSLRCVRTRRSWRFHGEVARDARWQTASQNSLENRFVNAAVLNLHPS